MPFLPLEHQKLGLIGGKTAHSIIFHKFGLFFHSDPWYSFGIYALRTEIENATTFLLSIQVSISRSRWESCQNSVNYYRDFTPRPKLRCFMHRNDFSLFSPKLQSEFLLPSALSGSDLKLHTGCWVSFESSWWARFHGRAKTYADWVWYSSKIGELWHQWERAHQDGSIDTPHLHVESFKSESK